MRLRVDLRFAPEPAPEGDRDLPLYELATLVTRRPRRLAGLLWGRRWDTVTLAVDGLPPSGVQAAGLVISSLARGRHLEIDGPKGRRRVRRGPLIMKAFATLAIAAPRELIGSVRTYRRAQRFLKRPIVLPKVAEHATSVAYVRSAPSIRYLGHYIGGAAAHTSGVIGGLLRAGLDVRIYAVERPERAQGARFVEVPLRSVYHVVHWLTATAYSQDLVRAAASEDVDFVYQRYVLGSYSGLELAERLGVPFVLEFNGSEIWAQRNWGTSRLPLLDTLEVIEERNVRDASLVVVVSDVLKDALVEQGFDSSRVLVNPNGVDVDSLAPLREQSAESWREALGRPNAPTVGFLGTFGLWHGVKVLPAIIDSVAHARADANWLLIGDGPLYPEVSEEIRTRGHAERVDLTGVVSHARAMQLLATCDICVSPHVHNPDGTRFFGSPTKLFEYMGLGKAIVASDLEQIGDVLDHERTALLCPPGDAEAAASGVVRLLMDADLRDRLGNGALAAAAQHYSWDGHARRILNALASGVRSAEPSVRTEYASD